MGITLSRSAERPHRSRDGIRLDVRMEAGGARPPGHDEIDGESGRSAVSSQLTGVGTEDGSAGEFGANEWLVDELYEQFVHDKNSVDKSWWPILENYHPAVKDESIPDPGETPSETPAPTPSEPSVPSP